MEKAIGVAEKFVEKLVGPSFDEVGLLFADNVKIWRLKNQIKNLEKAKKIVEENNLNIKQINLKVLVPYLEGVSLEVDENLQDMWANLLVNYIDAEKNLKTNVYPEILKNLSTDDVDLLLHMKENNGSDAESYEIVMGNLQRLGLVEPENNMGPTGYYYLTLFGIDFLKACNR